MPGNVLRNAYYVEEQAGTGVAAAIRECSIVRYGEKSEVVVDAGVMAVWAAVRWLHRCCKVLHLVASMLHCVAFRLHRGAGSKL